MNSITRMCTTIPNWIVEGDKVRIIMDNPIRVISADKVDTVTLNQLDDEIICVDGYREPTHMSDYAFQAIAQSGSGLLTILELRKAVEADLLMADAVDQVLELTKEHYRPEDGFDYGKDPIGTALRCGLGYLADGMGWIYEVYDEDTNPVGYGLTRLGRIANEVINGTQPIVEVK